MSLGGHLGFLSAKRKQDAWDGKVPRGWHAGDAQSPVGRSVPLAGTGGQTVWVSSPEPVPILPTETRSPGELSTLPFAKRSGGFCTGQGPPLPSSHRSAGAPRTGARVSTAGTYCYSLVKDYISHLCFRIVGYSAFK